MYSRGIFVLSAGNLTPSTHVRHAMHASSTALAVDDLQVRAAITRCHPEFAFCHTDSQCLPLCNLGCTPACNLDCTRMLVSSFTYRTIVHTCLHLVRLVCLFRNPTVYFGTANANCATTANHLSGDVRSKVFGPPANRNGGEYEQIHEID